jgi:glycerol-3-phosphate dehydrogenase (NAD(P)+)
MGTALAFLLARCKRAVRLVARDAGRADRMQTSRENATHLPGFPIPDCVEVTPTSSAAFAGADLLVVAIPSAFLRQGLENVAAWLPAGIPVLSVVKGIERETFARPSEMIAETLGPRPIAILSGPSHAEEIVRGLPTSVVVAGHDERLNAALQDALNGGSFRVYTNPDAVGVEIGGALKNILGIAAGICDGLRFGDNAKAALLTRGLAEIARFASSRGAQPETFRGLAGVGDVLTTCYSPFGRNRAVGLKIGEGNTLAEIMAGMSDVAEGITTTQSVHAEALRREIDMPITTEVYRILFDGKSPRTAVTDLMLRDPKVESS